VNKRRKAWVHRALGVARRHHSSVSFRNVRRSRLERNWGDLNTSPGPLDKALELLERFRTSPRVEFGAQLDDLVELLEGDRDAARLVVSTFGENGHTRSTKGSLLPRPLRIHCCVRVE
jgi:hypothetical protein